METEIDLRRRSLLGAMGAAGAAASVGVGAASAATEPAPHETRFRAIYQPDSRLFRQEADVRDCEIEGSLPPDLAGTFYRVGPDPQFRLAPGNIPFDGEGHASMFRIRRGRVQFRSRYVRNERFLAQEQAHRALFPMYRNPYLDDPSVKGLSRSTANTHIVPFGNLLLSLKEDSPPAALDLDSLETTAPNYTFDSQLPSRTFTAHPKFDSRTGSMVAFGYEAEGHGTDVVSAFEVSKQGKVVWNAKIRVPYVNALHDFAVTDHYIAFFLMPLTFDAKQMERGGIHWSWDGELPSYFGFIRRGGDGRDLRWIKGPTRGMFHVMGAFDDGKRLYVDMPLALGSQLPFMPQRDGSPWDPVKGQSVLTRVSVDVARSRPRDYAMEVMYPHHGGLPRQDDRYNTVPYRYGFDGCSDPADPNPFTAQQCYARFDHQSRQVDLYRAPRGTALGECVFAPRNASAAEGDGYLIGVAVRNDEGGRADLLVLDAQRLKEGPVATVHMPTQIVGQVHGWWHPDFMRAAT